MSVVIPIPVVDRCASTSPTGMPGNRWRTTAQAPVTAGAASEVPDMLIIPPVARAETIDVPGANSSTPGLRFDHRARAAVESSMAATVTASGAQDGTETASSNPSLPAEITVAIPTSTS